MKRLSLLVVFFYSISVHALPDCPSDTSVRWNNCLGTYTYADGDKYVGEWKDDKYHGQGTYTSPSGGKYVGEWKDGEYIPDICEGMGLVKGTESFGNCVVKLIDEL